MTTPPLPPPGDPPWKRSASLGPFDLLRLVSTSEVARLAGVSVSSIRRWRDEDPEFPQPLLLGDRTLRWPLHEVLAWLASRPRVDGGAWPEEADDGNGGDAAPDGVAARRARDEAAARRLDAPALPGLRLGVPIRHR